MRQTLTQANRSCTHLYLLELNFVVLSADRASSASGFHRPPTQERPSYSVTSKPSCLKVFRAIRPSGLQENQSVDSSHAHARSSPATNYCYTRRHAHLRLLGYCYRLVITVNGRGERRMGKRSGTGTLDGSYMLCTSWRQSANPAEDKVCATMDHFSSDMGAQSL